MSKEDNSVSLLLPGENAWELWKQSANGPTLVQSAPVAEGGSPSSFKSASVMAYPVVASHAVPIWAQSADTDVVQDVVGMQLETRGMQPEQTEGSLLKTRIVDREATQTLTLNTILAEKVLPGMPAQRPSSFELSPYFYELPENSVVLWKELGRLVLCITRADHPVYFHALTGSELDADTVGEIENLLMPLYMQNVVGNLTKVAVCLPEVSPQALQLLSNALQLPARKEPRPKLILANLESAFEPTAVAQAKIREAKMARIRNIISLCVLAYATLVAGIVAWYLYDQKQTDELKIRVNNLQARVQHVQPTIDRWNQTAPLREKDDFVIEIARKVMEPVSQRVFPLLITKLRVSTEKEGLPTQSTRVEVEGEASTNTAVNRNLSANALITNYRSALATGKETAKYKWTQPQLKPNRGDRLPFSLIGNWVPNEAAIAN
jgi:hypothetical protein